MHLMTGMMNCGLAKLYACGCRKLFSSNTIICFHNVIMLQFKLQHNAIEYGFYDLVSFSIVYTSSEGISRSMHIVIIMWWVGAEACSELGNRNIGNM